PKIPVSELDAVVKLQKLYKSYWIGRNLTDCAAVADELWWKVGLSCSQTEFGIFLQL
ncbi:hypothetical protein MKW92_041920, partial [Papaver armeniacum]